MATSPPTAASPDAAPNTNLPPAASPDAAPKSSERPHVSATNLRTAPARNPYSRWKRPFRWRHWERVQALHRDYAAVRVGLNEFEQKMLIPELRDRVTSMGRRFEHLKQICREPDLPAELAPALAAVMPRQMVKAGMVSQQVVKHYLEQTEQVIDNAFAMPLRQLEAIGEITDVPALYQYLQQLNVVCTSITNNDKELFRYRMGAHFHVTNTRTGEVKLGVPEEFAVILTPFQAALEELRKTADGTADTIRHWREQIDASKKPFLEYLAASTNAATSRRTIVIQTLAIILALSFSTFFMTVRDPFGLRSENATLRGDTEQLQQSNARVQAEIERLRPENVRLRAEVEQLRRASKGP